MALVMVVFARCLGVESTLYAELFAVILAIELVYSKGCFNLWLETNSKLVTLAFNKATLVPRHIRNIYQHVRT